MDIHVSKWNPEKFLVDHNFSEVKCDPRVGGRVWVLPFDEKKSCRLDQHLRTL